MPKRAPSSHEGTARSWPFTIRISRNERKLLQEAANREKTSRAEITRIVLNPLFDRLADELQK